MHWYNPMTRTVEDVAAPSTDEEAMEMLSGASDSRAHAEKYIELRREGMGVEQAMIFVGHHWRMWHLRYQPVGYKAGSRWANQEPSE
jgi:hypothetical protein